MYRSGNLSYKVDTIEDLEDSRREIVRNLDRLDLQTSRKWNHNDLGNVRRCNNFPQKFYKLTKTSPRIYFAENFNHSMQRKWEENEPKRFRCPDGPRTPPPINHKRYNCIPRRLTICDDKTRKRRYPSPKPYRSDSYNNYSLSTPRSTGSSERPNSSSSRGSIAKDFSSIKESLGITNSYKDDQQVSSSGNMRNLGSGKISPSDRNSPNCLVSSSGIPYQRSDNGDESSHEDEERLQNHKKNQESKKARKSALRHEINRYLNFNAGIELDFMVNFRRIKISNILGLRIVEKIEKEKVSQEVRYEDVKYIPPPPPPNGPPPKHLHQPKSKLLINSFPLDFEGFKIFETVSFP